jgi:hypothetical protein
MANSPLTFLRAVGRFRSLVIRLTLTLVLMGVRTMESFVDWKGSQPIGVVGVILQGLSAVMDKLKY